MAGTPNPDVERILVDDEQLSSVKNAVSRLYSQSNDGASSEDELFSRFTFDALGGCYGGMWCGMYVGIELDGHTHS